MKKLFSLFALSLISSGVVADNYTISMPDYLCTGTPTGWTSTPSSTGVTIHCAATGGSTPPPGAPVGCQARLNGSTGNVTLPSGGGTAALSVTCTSPSSGVAHNWSKNGTYGVSTAASWTDTLGANTSSTTDQVFNYQVRECVGSACVTVNAAPLVVTVPKTGGGGWSGTCPGFANTRVINIPWGNPVRVYTRDYGGFGVNDIIVAKMHVGNISTGSSLPRLTAAEYQSSPSSRTAVLSATPCDLGPQPTPGATNIGNSITAVFATGTGSGYGYYPVLNLNTDYYLNMKNNTGATCTSTGLCDMFLELIGASNL